MLNLKDAFRIARLLPLLLFAPLPLEAATGTVLFEDNFNESIPGWTAVEPPGANAYIDQPLRWQWDEVSEAWAENSNRYTDGASNSVTATAPMLINDATVAGAYTFKARLRAGDDDGFGLIFGYQNPTNFYRLTFGRQTTGGRENGFPYFGWLVDRRVDGVSTILYGYSMPDMIPFTLTDGIAFDVTISISADQKLTLSIIDDPEGGQIPYELVTAGALPTAPDGQVGLMVWGMGGGGPPTGIQISELSLEPVALVNNPPAPMIPEWTQAVSTREGGEILNGHGIGIWGLALGTNGVYGTLLETSDAFGGNDSAGQIDYVSSMLVAGDVAWTDYIYSVRVIPGDDDGHGIVLRYQDEMNFYRVALRAQNSTIGPRRGLSVQKVVGGVWEEVFFEDAPQFVPPSNVPYDISALMVDDTLHITVVSDPDGAAQRFTYGPIVITGATVPSGKIGLLSWAMLRTEFDNVRVVELDGIPLAVVSEVGSPTPAVGTHGFAPGTSVTASVESPVSAAPGVRRVVTGWTGGGSVPAAGTGTSVTFPVNEISSITWNWATEVQLTATAGTGGQVTVSGEWIPMGSMGTITAQANPGYVFTRWSGGTASTDAELEVTMNGPLSAEAVFEVDSDGDSIPDRWEQLHFGSLSPTATSDADSDGESDIEEYRRGTNPNHEETVNVTDGLPPSRWINTQRDPALPGHLVVRDFGNGFRGVWENSNDYREANTNPFLLPEWRIDNVSFEGPRMIIRPEVWQEGWSDFTGSAIFSVGDNDGNCVYFRYQDELNWYRVTVSSEDSALLWRAKYGVSIQKRLNGVFSEIAVDPFMPGDPDDGTDPNNDAYFKRFRISVTAAGPDFEVRVEGWDVNLSPPDWNPSIFSLIQFSDTDHPTGRFGVGTWGQSGGNTATPSNPVNAGVLIEDVVVTVGGTEVFREEWADIPLGSELPAGWTNPNTGTAAGTWQVAAHHSIIQTSNYSVAGTGTEAEPKGDAEGAILLAPALDAANYLLEVGFHPFDNDGLGFVFDFQDLDNFSRVLFVSEGSGPGRVPQGVTVSRKSGGVWSDLVLGDPSFVYTPGSPFSAAFANNNGQYLLRVWNVDDPSDVRSIRWSGPAAAAGHRFGLTSWGQQDAHYTYVRASALPAMGGPQGEVTITSISAEAGTLTLTIERPEGTTYAVERSTTLEPDSWTEVATAQSSTTWTTPLPAAPGYAFWRVKLEP